MSISPARAVAFDILLRVDQQNAYASELLHSDRLEKLTPADRSLAMELVMGVLRWRSRLDEAIAAAASRPLKKLDAEVLTALRLAAYQLRFLTRVPAHAALNESVELVKRAQKRSAAPFANAVLRKIAEAGKEPLQPSADEAPASFLAREYAHPEWLVERWVAQFGVERTRQICEFDQRIPATSLRLEDADAEPDLASEGVKLAPGVLLASSRTLVEGDLTRTRAYIEGRGFIQDEASQLVAALVGTGSRLLDCCAAPGGKTAAMAWRNPTAQIIAAEIHEHRAALVRKRVRAANVKVIAADALQLPLAGGFDRVLADVPCSGTGTLARNPDIKWRLAVETLSELHTKQVAILRAALQQLAAGGRAVYSTCSLEREENEAVVEEVLRDTEGYRLRDCREELEKLRATGELKWEDLDSLLNGTFLRTIPGMQPCDGFFAAVIEKQ
ncbi:MAG TPA: 16S rRNA (cytosine(967)-C(5))-methyltransferase RsmB [Terriglobales bacterium]|jgi:16S rRNA (cytosine967-C5)-methyltransferase